MKPFVFVSVLLCALILGSVSWKSTAATNVEKRKAVAEFIDPVTIQGVVLQGKYLFVHDDAAMSRGNACSYIYRGEVEARDKLVVSFHCIHVERARAERFTLRSRVIAPGVIELTEFQFTGETAGHSVPLPPNTAVVPVVN